MICKTTSIIERIITQYLDNNCDILCLDSEIKVITSRIIEYKEKLMIFDEKFSVEIKLDEKRLNKVLYESNQTKESLNGSSIKAKVLDIELYHSIENDDIISYHLRLLINDFEINFPPTISSIFSEPPRQIEDENEIYLKIYEIKFKETQAKLIKKASKDYENLTYGPLMFIKGILEKRSQNSENELNINSKESYLLSAKKSSQENNLFIINSIRKSKESYDLKIDNILPDNNTQTQIQNNINNFMFNEEDLPLFKSLEEEIKENTSLPLVLIENDTILEEQELLEKLKLRIHINEENREKELNQCVEIKTDFKKECFLENLREKYDNIYPKIKIKHFPKINRMKKKAKEIYENDIKLRKICLNYKKKLKISKKSL